MRNSSINGEKIQSHDTRYAFNSTAPPPHNAVVRWLHVAQNNTWRSWEQKIEPDIKITEVTYDSIKLDLGND